MTGLAVLAGWAGEVDVLKGVASGLATMKVNTALAFVFAGLGLGLDRPAAVAGSGVARWPARACAVIVVLIGLATLMEYALGRNLGIDELWIRDSLATRAGTLPGRPAGITALNFVLLGLALLSLDLETRGGRRPAQWFALLVAVTAFLAIVGYAYGVRTLYAIVARSSMALHTAVLFFLLPIGLLAARPREGWMQLVIDQGPGGMLFRRLLPAAIMVPPVVGGIRLLGQRAGFYGLEFGLAIFATSNVVLFATLVGWTAAAVRRTDLVRRSAEERFRAIFESAPAGIVMVDETGSVVLVNARAEEEFGYERRELLGQKIGLLIPARFRAAHPGLRSEFFGVPAHRQMGTGRDLMARRKDGSEFNVEIGLSPVATDAGAYVIATIIDISERRRAEMMSHRLAAIVESSEDAIIGKGLDGVVTSWNKGAERLFGFTSEEMIGTSVFRVIPAERHGEEHEILQRVGEGRTTENLETQRLARDGRLLEVSVTASPIRDGTGRIVGVSAIARDIAERRRLMAELQRANDALVRSNEELQQFAYIASHDLQTPLRNVTGFVQLLQANYADRLDDRARDWIDRTVRAAAQMSLLVQDVLAYSRVDSRPAPFAAVPLDQVFASVVEQLEASVRDAGGEVTRGDLPVVMGDRAQLAQLLQNLIGNGLKYRNSAPPRVHVSCETAEGGWQLTVRDNGIGIAPKHHARIFEIFKRLHNQQEYPGTGIGLAICRRVVHRHGGRIWVESEAGHGSAFHFTLPNHNPESS